MAIFLAVDSSRQNYRYSRQPRCAASHEIRAPAAVAVRDIGMHFSQVSSQSEHETKIEIATAVDIMDGKALLPRGCIDCTSGCAHDGVFQAAALQAANQVNHLLGASVQMATGFNVHHFHWDYEPTSAIDLTRSRG